jgi:hypothetical protein
MHKFNSSAFNRSASLLLAFGISLSQVAAYAQVAPAGEDIPTNYSTPPTQATPGRRLIAQAPSAMPMLQGRVSNVDSLSRDILKEEIKLEKYNLSYRLNAAKQGRWKGWRYFFFQECGLGLSEASLIANDIYRGGHLHITNLSPDSYGFQTAAFTGTQFASIKPGTGFSPPATAYGPRHTNRPPTLSGEVYIPALIGGFFNFSGDAIELGINAWHMLGAHSKGFSQAQSRKYVSGLVAAIDKKMAERDAAIRQEPAADAETAQLQALEGKVLADFRDLSISEFERFHAGAARVMARENGFYIMDMAKAALIIYAQWEVMSYVLRKHNRGIGDISICNSVSTAQIMMNPILSRLLGNLAVALDKRSMRAVGLPPMVESANRLKSDFSAMQSFAANHRDAGEKPEVLAALSRMDAYSANNAYYVGEAQKEAAELRRGNRAAIQNMGMGLYVGGSRLYLAIGGDYIAAYHSHERGPATFVNTSGKPILVPFANSVAGPLVVNPGATVATPYNVAPPGLTLVTYGSPKASPSAVGTFGNISPVTGKPTAPGNGGLPGGAGVWNGREVNEWLYTAGVIGLVSNSIAICDSLRIRFTGEATYQRAKHNHVLPGQIIRARMAQLDQLESKI